MSPRSLEEAWVLHRCGDKMRSQNKNNNQKTVKITLNQILIVACALVFIVSSVMSTIYVIKSANTIDNVSKAAESTALMCTERLINEAKSNEERKTTINVLQRENLFLRGKLQTFEKLYGLSQGTYEDGVGGDE